MKGMDLISAELENPFGDRMFTVHTVWRLLREQVSCGEGIETQHFQNGMETCKKLQNTIYCQLVGNWEDYTQLFDHEEVESVNGLPYLQY